jgi:ABC-type antimicrobial peptide transport system permease subunit
MAAFGAFGLLLAALGVYGVMALGIAQRTTEFGIRMALGASLRDIVPAVLTGQLALVGSGIALGAAAAVGVGRAIERVLPGAGGLDPALAIGASLLMLTTAALACAMPLRALGRIDPAAALKAE